ncbi:RHS repeat domain-containing protein [Schinkia sp. CFF1]
MSKEINPAGKITSFKYDKNGNTLSTTDRDGLTTQFDYDNIGNIKEVLYDDGKQINYEYNPLGQMTKIIDWLGTTSFDLDVLGRIKKVNDYKDKTVEYTWGATGEKLSMKYPDGSLVNYDYDSMGRLQKVTDADQASTTYKYDILGNVTEKLLPNGMKTEYSYDALSRLNSMTNKDNKGKVVDAYNYAYDAVGNKTSIERKHQGDGLLSSVLDPNEPTEGMTKYQYDSLYQLTEVTNPNKTVEKYFYDKLGNRLRHDHVAFNKVIYAENYNYDAEGRLSEISGSTIFNAKGKAFQDQVKMEYDNRGNVTKTLFGDKVLSEYTFNAANQLEKATNWKNESTTFSYDGLGRRVSQSIEKGYPKNADIGKLFDEVMATLKDQDGVLSNYLKTDDAFDAFGSLKSGSKNIDYTMDITSPYNNLIGMEDGTTRSTFVYGLDVISMTDQTLSNQGNKNLFNPKSSVQKNYYLQDELGSPIRLVDSKGKTTERYSYDEFGAPNGLKMALGLSKSSNPFGFTGYPYDPSTGLHFAQARYYAAGVGRFISEDGYKGEITNPLSLNPYTFVQNNPVNNVDPTGYWCTSADGNWSHPGGCNSGTDGEVFRDVGTSSYINDSNAINFGRTIFENGIAKGKWYPDGAIHLDCDNTGITDAFIGCAYDSDCAGFVTGGMAEAPAIYNGAKSGISKGWDWVKGLIKPKGIDNAIPNFSKATIDPRKLTDYALNPNHPVGGNKAKVFESALGYNQSNAGKLMKQIQKNLANTPATLGKADQYGQRYTVDMLIKGANGKTATVRTGWIIKSGSNTPEMTTLFVK